MQIMNWVKHIFPYKYHFSSILLSFFKYFIRIWNLKIIGNFKLILLVEHVLMTASGV